MITHIEKPSFLDISLFGKAPNRIEATQHFWRMFISDMRSRFMITASSCDRAQTTPDKDFISAIKHNSTNAIQALDAMATRIRLDLSSIKATRTTFSFYAWLTDFIKMYRLINDLAEGDIILDVCTDLQDSFITTDDLLLQQVIYFFLGHAIKHGLEGSRIKVVCKKHHKHLIIEVCYQEMNDRPYKMPVQTPFLHDRADANKDTLGLYISCLYVEAMNGSISVENRDAITVFSISLIDEALTLVRA